MKHVFLFLALFSSGCGSQPHPCAFWEAPKERGRVSTPLLTEASGLVVSTRNPGVLWALQDSGNTPTLFALRHDGSLITAVDVAAKNTDWEALSLGPCSQGNCLYIGDIGDNLESRREVHLFVVEEPLLDGTARAPLQPRTITLHYPDGPQNAEALVVTADATPLIFTKRKDGYTHVYEATHADTLDDVTLTRIGTLDVSTLAINDLPAATTDASLSPDGTRLLIRTYLGAFEFYFPDGNPRSMDHPRRVPVPFAVELQGESIAYDMDHHAFFQLGEGRRPFLWMVTCAGALQSHL